MQRTVLCSVCCWLILASTASAQQTSLTKSMWPFGPTKKATNQPDGGLRTSQSLLDNETADSSGSFFRWPSPTNMLQRAEAGTDAMFLKTRSTFKGIQAFGRRLMPFSAKPEAKNKRSSFLPTYFPRSCLRRLPRQRLASSCRCLDQIFKAEGGRRRAESEKGDG